MFSGIVERTAEVVSIRTDRQNKDFTLRADFCKELKIDQSIAHNGVCLTVVDITEDTYTVTAMKETLDRSNLGLLREGDLHFKVAGFPGPIALGRSSRPWDAEDDAVLALAERCAVRIAAANKSDCAPRWDAARLSAHFDSACIVSAKEKTGLDALGAAVAAAFPMPEADSGEILTNARQADAVRRALEYLRGAREAMAAGFAPDAVLTECEGAMDALGALSGRSVREDVTQEIFSRFCVGK